MSSTGVTDARAAVEVSRWPGERLFFVLLLLFALIIWAALVVSIFGIAYALMLGVFFFFGHLIFITHLRGNSVRLGPDQFPELYQRVLRLSAKVGLKEAPEAYLMQSGGSINALATKFLGRKFIVLFSDLVEACGDNEDALDFIVGHELGHLRAGHLRWHWVLLPGYFVPFLGTAYSRCCEYTCDRYGFAVSQNRTKALDGLCILAAGGALGAKVNRNALSAQRQELNGPMMKLGEWLSTHPPITKRLDALNPELAPLQISGVPATAGALLFLLALFVLPIAGGVSAFAYVKPYLGAMGGASGLGGSSVPDLSGLPDTSSDTTAASGLETTDASAQSAEPAVEEAEVDPRRTQVDTDIMALAALADEIKASGAALPKDQAALYKLWTKKRPGEAEPNDPYSGGRYLYKLDGKTEYMIWSTGPDAADQSDDLYYASKDQAANSEEPTEAVQ
jgi:Zn-dependent protease with chaperone function